MYHGEGALANHRVVVQNNSKYRDASRAIELFPVYVCGRNGVGAFWINRGCVEGMRIMHGQKNETRI